MSGIAQATVAAVQATEASVKDPKQLSRHVNDLQRQANAMLSSLKNFPILFGNLLKAQTFIAGTTQYLAHNLNRPYTGYLVTQAQTPFFGATTLVVTSLPSGKTTDKYIALTSTTNGTFDIYVF